MRRLLLLLPLLLLNSAAAIQISEIMCNPSGSDTGHEWIELYNNESAAVNMTGWKFFEGGTNHGITIVNGSGILDAGTYAIIADNPSLFLGDYPLFSGMLFDSSFSLSNTGEYLALKDSNSTIVENISYVDAAAEGKTLQMVSGNFCEGTPTPGLANSCADDEEPPPSEEEQYDLKLEVKIQNATQNMEAKNLFKLTNLDYETNQDYMNVTVEFTIKLNNEAEYEDSFTAEFKQSKSIGTGEWTPQSFGEYTICGKITDAPFADPDESNNGACEDITVYENQDNETISEDVQENNNLAAEENQTKEISLRNSTASAFTKDNCAAGAYVWTAKTKPSTAVLLFVGVLLVLTISLLFSLANLKRHNSR